MASDGSPEIEKKVETTVTEVEPSEELYFTKDGRTRTGPKAPTAYAWSYPWPPCPTNLCKNKVFRPKEEDFEKAAKEAKEKFEKEARPLGILEIEGKPLIRMPVPEIELALYWDKHPFEFRPSADLKRAKSAVNLSFASTVGDLLHFDELSDNQEPSTINGNNNQVDNHRRNRGASADSRMSTMSRENKSRSSSASVINSQRKHSESKRNSHTPLHGDGINNSDNIKQHIQQSNNNHKKSKSSSPAPTEADSIQEFQDEDKSSLINSNPRLPKILQVLNQKEKRKFDDLPKRQSNGNGSCQHSSNGNYNPPKVVRDLSRNSDLKKSIGVQATIDGLTSAALKSTYSCPLHGSYQRGMDRRAKNGFRTDMSSTLNPHARCSRSRTKFLRDTEIQTEDTKNSKKNDGSETKKPRSKTAGANSSSTRHRGHGSNKNMVSEYHGNFRHPGHISDSENRRLRNKILSYCFTKHSIF